MAPLAAKIQTQLDALAAEYDQRLQEHPAYAALPAQLRRDAAQRTLQLVIESLDSGDDTPLIDFIQATALRRWQQGFDFEAMPHAINALDATLEPLITDIKTAKRVARTLARVRDGVTRLAAEQIRAESQRRLQETLVMNRIMSAATSTLEPEAILATMCRELAQMLNLPRSGFALLQKDNATLKVLADYRPADEPSTVGVEIVLDKAPATRQVIESRQPLAIADAQTDERQPDFQAVARQYHIVSQLIVPLVVRGKVIGTLGLDSAQPHDFTPDEISLVEDVATVAGQMLDTAQLYATLQTELAERTQAEEALRESEVRFRTVADFTYGWETWLAPDGHYLYVSPACQRISGYSAQDFIDNPGLFSDIAYPEDRDLIENHLRDHQTTSERQTLEYRIRTKDGQVRWINHVCVPVHDVQGNFQGRRGSNTDITRRKQAEEETRIRLKVAQALANAQTEEQVLDGIIEAAGLHTEARIIVYTTEKSGDETLAVVRRDESFQSNIPPQVRVGMRLPTSSLPILQVLTTEKIFRVDNLLTDSRIDEGNRTLARNSGSKGFLAVPLMVGDELLGLITATSLQEGYFDESKARLYLTLAEQATAFLRDARLQDQVRASQQRLALLVESSPLAVIEWNTHFEVVSWNPAAEHIFGYTFAEARGRHMAGLIVPAEHRAVVDQVWADLLTQGGSTRSTNGNVTKDGRAITCDWFNTPLIGADDQVIGVASVVMDVTERQLAETRLRESEEQYRKAIVAADAVPYYIDYQAERYRFIGEAIAKLTGYQAEEITPTLLGQIIQETIMTGADSNLSRSEAIQKIRAGEVADWKADYRLIDRNGETHWLSDASVQVLDEQGKPIGAIGILQDITERKWSEQVIRDSENQFRSLFEGASDAIFTLRGDRFIDCNSSTLKIFGLADKADIIGRSMVDFSVSQQPDGQPALLKAQEKIRLTLQGEPQVFDWVHMRRDGAPFDAEISLNRVKIGEEMLVQASVRDVTERRRAEAYIQQSLREAEIHLRLSQAFAQANTEDQVLDAMLAEASRYPEVGIALITFEESAGEQLAVVRRVNDIASAFPANELGMRVSASQYPLMQYLTPDQPFVTLNLLTDERVDPVNRESWTHANMASLATLPLTAGNEWLGLLAISSSKKNHLDEQKLYLYQSIAEQGANALRDARLRAALNIRLAVLETSPDFIGMATPDGKAFYVNPAGLAMTGYPAEALGSLKLTDFQPDMKPEDVSMAVRTGIWRSETTLKHRDGHLIPVEQVITTLNDGNGNLQYLITIARDVTERLKLQQEIQAVVVRRGFQVQTSAEVAQEIAAAPELDELFSRVVSLIKERFNYYHAQIFRYDPVLDTMVLAVGYGEAGRTMLAAGHHLPMGHGIVGTAATTGQSMLATDVTQDPDWRPNPALPYTRGELAVPIKLRGQILGVLDVQSDQAGVLIYEDQMLLEGLCGQIAAASQSTRLLEETRRTQLFLDSLIESLPIMVFGKEATELRFARWNKAAEELTGFKQEEMLGKNDYDLFPKEEADFFTIKDREALAGKVLVDIPEEQIQTRNKGIRLLHTRKIPILDEQGNPQFLLGISEDITERKEAEQRLTDSERLMRTLIDTIPDYIFAKDAAGRHILGNAALMHHYGLKSADEFIGKSDFDLYPHELAEEFFASEQAILRDGQSLIAHEEPNVDASGVQKWHMTTKVPLRDGTGQIIGLVGITNDITHRKQIEVELARSAQLLRTIISTSPDLIYIKDIDSRFLVASQAVARLAGAPTADDLIGKNDFDLFPHELASKYYADEQQIMKEGKPLIDIEEPSVYADGTPVWLLTTKVPFFNTDGTLMGIVGLGRDITERKKAEQQMAETLREVERLYATVSREGWRTFRQSEQLPEGYVYDRLDIQPARQLWEPEISQAMTQHATVATHDAQRAIAVTPLAVRGEIVGALGVYDKPDQPLTPEDLALIEATSEQVALALESARLFDQTQTALSEAQVLYEASADLSAAQTYDQVLAALRKYTLLGQADTAASINWFDTPWRGAQKPQWSTVLARWNIFPSGTYASRYPLSESTALTLMSPDAPLLVEDIATDPRLTEILREQYGDKYHGRSFIYVPLVAGGQWTGAVYGLWTQPTHFSETNIRRLMSLAAQAATVIQSLLQLAETQERARREQLLREISARVRGSTDPDVVLRTLARELGTALNRPTFVRLVSPSAASADGNGHPPQANGGK